jgi:hypothetical protein
MRSTLAGILLTLLLTGIASASDTGCATDEHVVDACFDVHGRLAIYADSRLYLWPIGTHRMLGVQYPPELGLEDLPLPENVDNAVSTPSLYGLTAWVYGDFRVCPFTHDEPGELRFVCIDRGSHLVLRPPPRPLHPVE